MPARDLCFTPATKLVRLFRTRKVSPLEVTQAVLGRIDQVNPKLNAYVTVARESALRAARAVTHALRRGAKLPPLHGVPVSIQDLTPTKGIRTTWGSKIYAHHVPEEAVRIFRSLGAKVEAACPGFREVNEIVLATRGLSMVALHADKLAQW